MSRDAPQFLCADADSRKTSHSATEAMPEPDFNPSSKPAFFPRLRQNHREDGEFINDQFSMVHSQSREGASIESRFWIEH